MTKEEIQKNSEHWYNKYKDAEKRIEELTEQNTSLLTSVENLNKSVQELEKKLEQTEKELADYQFNYPSIKELSKENAELEKQISILLSCKDCPENKGGYICEKEYNDKCLAQKIQYIKELKEEHKQNEIDLIISNSSARAELNDQLVQAKEIIKDLLTLPFANDWEVYANVTSHLDRAEQFLKNLEK